MVLAAVLELVALAIVVGTQASLRDWFVANRLAAPAGLGHGSDRQRRGVVVMGCVAECALAGGFRSATVTSGPAVLASRQLAG